MRNESSNTTTILVVDDNEMILDMAKMLLDDLGYIVVTTTNGSEGLSYYRDHWPEINLVVLDMVMPVMSGRETFTEMKKINPHIKAIMTSGYCVDCEAQKIMDMGASAFILKPYSLDEFANIIDKTINS